MLSDAHNARFFARMIAARPERVREVMEFRLIMEPEVAALAAERRTGEELERMRRMVEAQQSSSDADFPGLDARFHTALARATHNEVIWETTAMLDDLLSESRVAVLITPARRASSQRDHGRILEALRQGDPEAARAAMRAHLLHTGEEAGQALSAPDA